MFKSNLIKLFGCLAWVGLNRLSALYPISSEATQSYIRTLDSCAKAASCLEPILPAHKILGQATAAIETYHSIGKVMHKDSPVRTLSTMLWNGPHRQDTNAADEIYISELGMQDEVSQISDSGNSIKDVEMYVNKDMNLEAIRSEPGSKAKAGLNIALEPVFGERVAAKITQGFSIVGAAVMQVVEMISPIKARALHVLGGISGRYIMSMKSDKFAERATRIGTVANMIGTRASVVIEKTREMLKRA